MNYLRILAVLVIISASMLAACDGESQPFEEAVEIRNLQITMLTVTPPVNSQPVIFLNTNDTVRFGIEGLKADGTDLVLSGSGRNWTVDKPAVAVIDTNGLLTARSNGDVSVVVQIGDLKSIAFPLTVLNATLTGIDSVVGEATIERCLPQNYYAVGSFSEGALRNLNSAEWSVGDVSNARVLPNEDATATLTGLNPGSLSLVVSSGGITATTPLAVTVLDTLSEVNISPSPAQLDIDESQAFVATGTYNDQPATADTPAIGTRQVVISESVDWSITSGTDYAHVNNVAPDKGVVTGDANGNAILSATCGNRGDLQTVVVSTTDNSSSDQLSFNTTDNPLVIARSNTAGFRLRVSTGSTFSSNNEVTDEVTWTVDAVGSTTTPISLLETGPDAGLIRPNATGDAIVTATLDGQSISITVRVSVINP